MQAAARAAAAASTAARNLGINPRNSTLTLPDVPDGLGAPGGTGPGLSVAYKDGAPTLWVGASAPTQVTSSGSDGSTQFTVTVAQQQQQAFLQWQTFDVGKSTSLVFDQSAGGSGLSNWIAFNYVRDPSGRPSQILGGVSAIGPANPQGVATTGGQIYVINANGIIFGGSSQVNAGALVASSLPINTNLVQRGLLNNPDDQFLFSALPLAPGTNGPTPAFDPAAATAGVAPAQTPYDPAGTGASGSNFAYGDVTVQAGAQLSAPSSNFVGGKVALVGPNATNAGTITTPDGQAIIAAGLQVGWAAHTSSDATLRGLDVFVGQVSDPSLPNQPPSGNATNADTGTVLSNGQPSPAAGLIDSPRGDVTLVGAAVNQLGVIDSTTSVSYNGRVDLLASYNSLSGRGFSLLPFFPQATGPVTLGADSLTQILPQVADTATVAAASLALPSTVAIQGSNVTFAGTADGGALLLAPNGTVGVDAGSWRFTVGGVTGGVVTSNSASTFTFDDGTIALADHAGIDVSGSENVSASVQEDIVAVQLLGPQLAGSPLQRNGPLRGQTIDVNILNTGTYNGQPWVGTPLADTSGYVGLIPHTVGELTVNGGSVSLQAGAAVRLDSGSTVDVAGGWSNFAGGTVQTTKLLFQGKLVDIAQATPDRVYDGIYTGSTTGTDEKWGVTSTVSSALPLGTYLASYVQGGNGGSLAITAGAITTAGTLFGETYAGQNQRQAFVPYTSPTLQTIAGAGIDPRVWELNSVPAPSSLSLTFQQQYLAGPGPYASYSPSPPDIYFLPTTASIPDDPNALVLSPSLTDPGATTYGGFGNLTIDDSAGNEKINAQNQLVVPALPSTQSITIPAGVTLETTPGGSVSLSAANIQIQGGIYAPGGTVSLTSSDFWGKSPYLTGTGAGSFGIPAYNPLRGDLTVGPQGFVSTNGLIVDSRSNAGQTGPLITGGGSVSLSGSNVTLVSGAVVSADGGALIGPTGHVTYGVGGALALEAGGEPVSGFTILGGSLSFDLDAQMGLDPLLAPLQAFSGSSGGRLTLESSLVQVGASPGVAPQPGTLVLPSAKGGDGRLHSFFDSGGFSNFTLIGLGDVLDPAGSGAPLSDSQGKIVSSTAVNITSGTATAPTLIHPRVEQMQVIPGESGSWQTQILAPFAYQNTPVSLTFSAQGVSNQTNLLAGFNALVLRGDVVVGAGATVQTDPQTSSGGGITLTGQTVTVLGNVIAPGGTISIKGLPDSTALFAGQARGLITVDLGPDSQISTAGLTLLTPDIAGRVPGEAGYVNTGTVVGGGSVTLSGNIVTESNPSNPNSVIDVSGWSDANDPWGLLYMAPQYSGLAASAGPLQTQLQTLIPTVEARNGGTITLKPAQALFPDKKMVGASGGQGATGGTLTVSGQAFGSLPGSGEFFDTLLVTASGPTIPGSFYPAGQSAIGRAVIGSDGTPLTGLNLANFSASSFSAGKFDSLNLYGAVFFQDTAPISVVARGELTIGGDPSAYSGAGFVSSNVAVSLSASEVSLGQSYLPPVQSADEPLLFTDGRTFQVTGGSGSLTVNAGSKSNPGLINVGNLTLQNMSVATLNSVAGDVQGYGTVDIAGNLTIAADAVFPSTAKTFTIDAYNTAPLNGVTQSGTVTFETSSSTPARPVPLSAGGTLSVYASVINQDGVLYAPLGTVNLGWNGAGPAPSTDRITGTAVPSTQTLALGAGSLTSVSGNSAGFVSGEGLPIPYGINLNGTSWIDPTGKDITSSGPPVKAINLQGVGVTIANQATIDASGGGNLYAYQFVAGTGGESDILTATSGSFAVLPGYAASYAPNAAFNATSAGISTSATNFLYPDPGYTSSSLAVGEQIRIDLGNGSGTQTYTLLPARYALLPGAYLVTPTGGSPVPSAQPALQPDGSFVTLGYMFNAFDPSNPLYSNLAVAPGTAASGSAVASPPTTVVRTRAQYADFLATTFFNPTKTSASGAASAPSIPGPNDGGQLAITATGSLSLQGFVDARASGGGQGGGVDISGSNSEAIVINDTGVAPSSGASADTLFLSAGELSNFGAGSLLIGGTLSGSKVTVTAPSVEVANDSGAALKGSDIVLAANGTLTVDPGAVIQATLSSASAASLQIADTLQLAPALSASSADAASTLVLTKIGSLVTFAQTVPKGETLTASAAGTLTSASGAVTAFAAGAKFTNTTAALGGGSSLSFTGTGGGALTLTGAGDSLSVTLGDGTLLRVSGSATAATSRIPIASPTAPTVPTVTIGANATLSGASVVVDSTNIAHIDPTSVLNGGISLRSGQISLVLDPSLAGLAASASPTSLSLSGEALAGLQANTTSLSLVSYSTIDTYGSGTIGGPSDSALSLSAGAIRGFEAGTGGQTLGATTSGTAVTFEAKTISLDNNPGATVPISSGTGAGTVTFDATAGAITLGANTFGVDQFANVALTATGGVLSLGSSATPGTLAVSGNLTVSAPIVTGTTGSIGTLTANQGVLTIAPLAGGTASVKGGLGASLTLQGSSVAVKGDVSLPSGNITVVANGTNPDAGGISIGGALDVGGTAQIFNTDTSYTDGGQIALNSSSGSVALLPGGYVRVAALNGGGNAGTLSVSAPAGAFSVAADSSTQIGGSAPSLDGTASKGQGGTFVLDVANLSDGNGNATASLGPLESVLAAGNFTLSQSMRVRTGIVVVDSTAKARTFLLSADDPSANLGNIELTPNGRIDASGPTGGSVELDASGSVTLDSGSAISVRGMNFNDAGRGGAVTLQAGSYVGSATNTPSDLRNVATGLFSGGAVVNVGAGSTVDLSVVNDHAIQLNPGGASASTPPGAITVPPNLGVYFPGGTPGNDTVIATQDGVATLADGTTVPFKAGSALQLPGQCTLTLSKAGTIAFGGGSGGSIPVDLPSQLAGAGALALSPVNTTDLTAFNSTGTLTLEARQVFDPSQTNPFDSNSSLPVDVRIDPIGGTIVGASSIAAVGFELFDLTPSGAQLGSSAAAATIDATIQGQVQQNGALFAGGYTLDLNGNVVSVTGNTAAITAALADGNSALGGLLHVRPGAEIVNSRGDLNMNTTWDFAQTAPYVPSQGATSTILLDRFGLNDAEAGVLLLRARGDIVLGQGVDPNSGSVTFASLNDGFSGFDSSSNASLIAAEMLPTGSQSWSYSLVAGADFSAADSTRVLSQANLAADRGGAGMGSILLGQGSSDLITFDVNFASDFFQTIRTGTGDIGLHAGLNIELMDNLFAIYTAGAQAASFANFQENAGSNAQFSSNGGDVELTAQGSIEHVNSRGQPDSSKELPLNWLDRQGSFSSSTGQFVGGDSTAWWIDFTNFFEGVGALGGGNVTLKAGNSIANVDAVIPTNERTTSQTGSGGSGNAVDKLVADQSTLELGGGDIEVQSGQSISGGVYYVERGQGSLTAGTTITTNGTRAALTAALASAAPALVTSPLTWMPTTLFLGDGNFAVQGTGNVLLGSVANPFLLPAPDGSNAYFSTYAAEDAIRVASLTGSVVLKDSPDNDLGSGNSSSGSLLDWIGQISAAGSADLTLGSTTQPWLALNVPQIKAFGTLVGIMPPSLRANSYTGDIDLVGGFTLSPSADGQIVLEAAGSINGFQPNSASTSISAAPAQWGSAVINLSDANPAALPSVANPLSQASTIAFSNVNSLFAESGSITGAYAVLQTQLALHSAGLLHAADPNPVVINASGGNISGITLYSAKHAQVTAGADITDISVYAQNDGPGDITSIVAGGDIVPYDPSSPLRTEVTASKQVFLNGGSQAAAPGTGNPNAGDIQIAGPGTLEVLAGGNINLGDSVGAAPNNGTSVGITSIGNSANPYLPFQGANIVVTAGIPGLGTLGGSAPGLANSSIDFADFISSYIDPLTAPANSKRYLPELANMVGMSEPEGSTPEAIWASLESLPTSSSAELDDRLALDSFMLVLRDAGRDHNDSSSPNFGAYTAGVAAISTLFPGSPTAPATITGNPSSNSVTMATRLVESTNGGDVAILAPRGFVTVGRSADPQKVSQGILTESGGNISIYAQNDVGVGTSRIFTLKGGNEIIWSTLGSIAAGSGSKTVHSAPPSRVLINPQSATVENDLAGLATGSGIGVLATLVGVPPGNVDLIAPAGTIDAGDAGIRASGNVSVAALHIVNASNIQASGATSGVPVVAAPNISGLTSASSATAASSSAASTVAAGQQSTTQTQLAEVPSLIDVEVLGYGGGDDFPT